MSPKQTDPSAVVVPFGKHKGATVAELLAKDPAYADWVMAQGWVAERFAELHAAIATRGAGTDDTPEHNALQARFLDAGFRAALLRVVAPGKVVEHSAYTLDAFVSSLERAKDECDNGMYALRTWKSREGDAATQIAAKLSKIASIEAAINKAKAAAPELRSVVKFEVAGVDVVVVWYFAILSKDWHIDEELAVELKPALGDDYPSVMRQMRRLGCRTCVVGQYTGRGVSEVQVREMFAANGFTLVFVQEIEEEVRRSA